MARAIWRRVIGWRVCGQNGLILGLVNLLLLGLGNLADLAKAGRITRTGDSHILDIEAVVVG